MPLPRRIAALVLMLAGIEAVVGPVRAAVPLPPRRADVLRPAAAMPDPKPKQPQPPTPAAAPIPAPVATKPPAPTPTPEETGTCDRLLAGKTVKAERMPAVDDGNGCAIAAPVKLSAIVLPTGKDVALEPPVIVRCALAAAVADWVRQDVAPLLVKHGGLVALAGTGGYQCRGRNRVQGAKLSEHATGNAIDILTFRSADGTTASIAASGKETAFFTAVKLTSCARFATVLGPGADGDHEDNLHLDLETRRHGTHLCQWELL